MTDRPRLDQLTDDKLDQLYARLERAEAERDALIDERDKLNRQLTTMTDVARSNLAHVRAIVPALEQAEATIERVRALASRAEKAHATGTSDYDIGKYNLATRILAALDGTT